MSAAALEALDRILNRGGDADDVLREVVAALVERGGATWAGILFVEEGELVLGPEAGEPGGSERRSVPVVFQGSRVGELAVEGVVDGAFLERAALLVSPYVLLGWDTGGEEWVP